MVAVTLCGDEHVAGEVIVHGERGRAVLWYTEDRLRLPGDPVEREVPGRVDLLDNLLAHRAAPASVPLLAGLARTEPFTALAEVVTAAPDPAPIAAQHQRAHGQAGERIVTVPGASRLVRQAAEELALPSELGAPWAVAPYRTTLTSGRGVPANRP